MNHMNHRSDSLTVLCIQSYSLTKAVPAYHIVLYHILHHIVLYHIVLVL
jgi:hypothetical protein